jgi:hypothetical protein
MTNPDDKVLTRIAALLAKANDKTGTTEAERDAFMAKATAMMSEHNIGYAQLNENKRSAEGDVTKEQIEIKGAMHQWKFYFYGSIAKPSFVEVIRTKRGKNDAVLWFFGRPDNLAYVRQLGEYLVPWLENECKEQSRRLKREAEEYGTFFNPKAFKRSFMQAASSVIYSRLETLRKAAGTPHALVTNEDAANQKAISKTFGQEIRTARGSSNQRDGHIAGAAAGRTADLSPGRKLNA